MTVIERHRETKTQRERERERERHTHTHKREIERGRTKNHLLVYVRLLREKEEEVGSRGRAKRRKSMN